MLVSLVPDALLIVTVGAEVYPSPPSVRSREETVPAVETKAVAAAPVSVPCD